MYLLEVWNEQRRAERGKSSWYIVASSSDHYFCIFGLNGIKLELNPGSSFIHQNASCTSLIFLCPVFLYLHQINELAWELYLEGEVNVVLKKNGGGASSVSHYTCLCVKALGGSQWWGRGGGGGEIWRICLHSPTWPCSAHSSHNSPHPDLCSVLFTLICRCIERPQLIFVEWMKELGFWGSVY